MKSQPPKLTGLHQLILHTYDNGAIECTHQRMDMSTRRVIPHTLFRTVQDHQDPFTPPDLLFIAAAELVANQLGYDYRLPF